MWESITNPDFIFETLCHIALEIRKLGEVPSSYILATDIGVIKSLKSCW